MFSPLEQFLIKPIIRINNEWVDFTISNSTIFLTLAISLIILVYNKNINNYKIIKNRYGYIIEKLYLEVNKLVKDMIPGEYKRYIPFSLILFLFILGNNILGLIPYSFTTTSHIIMTFTMSLSIMIGVTLIGLFKHKFKFFTLFLPSGLNQGGVKVLIPLIFFIEVISYLIRVISLSVRLSANLISGHTLLNIIANFGLKYSLSIPILVLIPISFLSAVYLLEIAVAVIQAYVFTLLTTTYVKDTELLH